MCFRVRESLPCVSFKAPIDTVGALEGCSDCVLERENLFHVYHSKLQLIQWVYWRGAENVY